LLDAFDRCLRVAREVAFRAIEVEAIDESCTDLRELVEGTDVCFVCCPVGVLTDVAREALAAEGIEATETPISPWGLRVAERRAVTTGATFRSGLVEIQDEGSQLVTVLADARPGMRVSDLCAGAGGKTLALAMAMGNRGHLLACDISAPRLEGAIRRLRRAGVSNVERHLLAAGDKLIKRRAGSFDRVLVDAPCSGTGTWRRNPDARLRLTEQDLRELRAKQGSVLATGAKLVRPGGKLIYATCSLLSEENEQIVSAFLDGRPDFTPVPAQRAWTLPGPAAEHGGLLDCTPAADAAGGFSIAVLARWRDPPGWSPYAAPRRPTCPTSPLPLSHIYRCRRPTPVRSRLLPSQYK